MVMIDMEVNLRCSKRVCGRAAKSLIQQRGHSRLLIMYIVQHSYGDRRFLVFGMSTVFELWRWALCSGRANIQVVNGLEIHFPDPTLCASFQPWLLIIFTDMQLLISSLWIE